MEGGRREREGGGGGEGERETYGQTGRKRRQAQWLRNLTPLLIRQCMFVLHSVCIRRWPHNKHPWPTMTQHWAVALSCTDRAGATLAGTSTPKYTWHTLATSTAKLAPLGRHSNTAHKNSRVLYDNIVHGTAL